MGEQSTTLVARARRSLRRHAAAGWQRVVFARPGEEATSAREHAASGNTPATAEDLTALEEDAQAAVAEGRTKITIVADGNTRIRIDARFGGAKVQHADPVKAMGGKDRALRPDTSSDLLRAIGLMNPDGSISAKHAKKYKQVNHFVELTKPVLERLHGDPLRVLDLGCGNGYLDFVLAEALRLSDRPALIHGVDRRDDVIDRARERAHALGWTHVTFATGDIGDVDPGNTPLATRPDLVLALHACDTATDDALALAIRLGTPAILCAPCCQRELADQLRPAALDDLSPALGHESLLRRDAAATLTDALRADILSACGFHVDVIEFVGSEHTPKNLLLRALRRHPDAPVDPSRWNLAPIRERCERLGLQPRLLAALTPPD